MPGRWRMVAGSGAGSRARDGNDKAVLQYAVMGYDDPLDAESFLLAAGHPPNRYDSKRLANYSWQELGDNTDAYLFTANYEHNRIETDEYRLNVDTSGGSIRMTNSLATSRYAASGSTAPDFGGAIDVDEGKPRGIDRIIPAVKMTLTYRLARPADPIAYTALGTALTGTVNNSPLLGHAAGELLFLGFTGDFGTDIDPTLQFSWAASKNATLTIGSIASVAKQGHEYLWILYEDEKTGTGSDTFVTAKPRAAYVERIYSLADHSLLGLLI